MAQRTKQNRSRPALPGILALASALVLMVALMITMSTGRPEPTEPETTTAPTIGLGAVIPHASRASASARFIYLRSRAASLI